MWDLILETCADIFGVTRRGRLGYLFVACGVVFVLGVVLMLEWGMRGWVPPAVLLLIAAVSANDVTRARDGVWRAACLPLDDTRQRPEPGAEKGLIAPTAAALHRLAAAVDLVRRGAFIQANELMQRIDRALLRAEEEQLLEASHAMISLGLGDAQRAAQRAAGALPTGSEDIDVSLGRAMVTDAWRSPARLHAIERIWARAGVAEESKGGLPRLRMLLRVRIDDRAKEQVQGALARDLSDEARAIGDEELAAELDARARPRAYR